MRWVERRTIESSGNVMSGILNWVCPECGGRMGGAGRAFKCQGKCQRDWRGVWEQNLAGVLRGRKRMSPPASRTMVHIGG